MRRVATGRWHGSAIRRLGRVHLGRPSLTVVGSMGFWLDRQPGYEAYILNDDRPRYS